MPLVFSHLLFICLEYFAWSNVLEKYSKGEHSARCVDLVYLLLTHFDLNGKEVNLNHGIHAS